MCVLGTYSYSTGVLLLEDKVQGSPSHQRQHAYAGVLMVAAEANQPSETKTHHGSQAGAAQEWE